MSRYGNFTSSNIYKLMSNGKKAGELGKPALTYIEEKRWEIKLGRNMQKEQGGRPTSWGTYIEARVYEMLSTDYILQSDVRYSHKTIEHWTGAPDMVRILTPVVCDIKAPYSLKVFCRKADIILKNDLEAFKDEFPENYWQLVSNAILIESVTGKPINTAELIIYLPYLKELIEIKEDIQHLDEVDKNKVAWLNWANDDELPYLIEGNYYKNLYVFQFEIPSEDKQLLTERVKFAVSLLKN
jgi:hypothetical protein